METPKKHTTEEPGSNLRLRSERFHSKLLVPWEIAQKGQEDIENVLLWKEAHQEGYKYKEGQAVAHQDNLYQKMYVQKILTSDIRMQGTKQVFHKLLGILCQWWENCPCLKDSGYVQRKTKVGK